MLRKYLQLPAFLKYYITARMYCKALPEEKNVQLSQKRELRKTCEAKKQILVQSLILLLITLI